MKKYLKSFIQRLLIGFPLGVAISATFALVFAVFFREILYTDVDYYVKAYFCSGAIGAIWSSCSVFFEVESWSMLKRTITHFTCTVPLFIVTSYIAGWTGNNIFLYIAIALVVYFVIYVIIMLITKARINKINKQLG